METLLQGIRAYWVGSKVQRSQVSTTLTNSKCKRNGTGTPWKMQRGVNDRQPRSRRPASSRPLPCHRLKERKGTGPAGEISMPSAALPFTEMREDTQHRLLGRCGTGTIA